MHYFIGLGIYHSFTGVDKAQFNRLKLFKQFNIPAKILTVSYHHLSALYAQQLGIQQDVLNMYDYFQKCNYTITHQTFDLINYWQTYLGYDVEIQRNKYIVKVMQNNRMIIYARFFDLAHTQPMFINHFNSKNEYVKHEEYDVRGFLSSISHYGSGNKVVYQEFFTPSGEKVIEKYFDDNNALTMIFLKNHYGQFEKFDSEQSLITYFFDLIYKTEDTFIIDRPLEIVPAFLNMKTQANASVVIHMKHLAEIDVSKPRLKWPYALLFNHLDRFKALITSTEGQKHDIESYIKDHHLHSIDVVNIPVGYIDQTQFKSEKTLKKYHHLISVSRYVDDKQLDHQIRVVHRLHKVFPELTLDLYGFGSSQQKLEALIHSLDADDYIKIKGFQKDLSTVYARASASLLTSNSEGFALAVLESLSYSTPVIAYDIDYGPKEMIINNVNGNLVELNNEEALYHTLYAFLSNKTKQIKYFNQCIPSIEPYYDENIIERWKHLFNIMRKPSDQ
ncbi:glycosyltransferase [Macrococcus equi]|uniref:glycosyltransferase n=1 Tax=Macrococcus equi TaxID=3395462 RepID=UPI0039BDAD1B